VEADVAVVTGVAMDHAAVLGSTLAAIASEKAAIFRPGRVAVIGQCGEPAATGQLVAAARSVGAQVVVAPPQPALRCELALAGTHQLRNAACALAAADALVPLDDPMRRAALSQVRWPGRMQTVAADPPVIIDGAHNPHAARTVAGQLAPEVCVIAISAGKDVDGIVAPLVARAHRVVVTEAGGARAVPAAAVAAAVARARGDLPVAIEPVAAAAIDRARAGACGLVLVAGSLFLAGEARQHLCGDRADPRWVSDPV